MFESQNIPKQYKMPNLKLGILTLFLTGEKLLVCLGLSTMDSGQKNKCSLISTTS